MNRTEGEQIVTKPEESGPRDPLSPPRNDAETMSMLREEGPLQAARRIFSSRSARIEQAHAQRRPPSPIEVRRMEFEAVAEIAEALGLAKAGA